ncbi:hypothetical protein [Planctopirus ephydatiae]|nr:hypothetical protein [Planctopirus ephydatiae]
MKPEERLAVWKKVLAEGGRPTMGKIKEAKRLGLPQAKVKSPLRPCINKLETAKRKLKKVVDELPKVVTESEKEPFRRRIAEMRGILDKLTERLDAGAEAKAA